MIGNRYFGNVVKLKYSGKIPTHQNCMHEEMKSRLNLRYAPHHLVQNVFVSHFANNIKIKKQKTTILCAVSYGCEM
jgi:hypothetical protein